MESEAQSWELAEHLSDASVSLDRFGELIANWDARVEYSCLQQKRLADPVGRVFAHQIEGVLQSIEQLHAAELRRVNALISSMLGAAAVLTEDGSVLAANGAAAKSFGLEPGGSIGSMPLDRTGLDEFAARVTEVAAKAGREDIVRLRPIGLARAMLVHLKAMRVGNGRPHVLAVTSELAWPGAVSEFLARAFALTRAEIEVMRLLAAGGTVAGIAAATGRGQSTVRSQLHAVLQKTGTQSQLEVMRLVILLMQSVPAETEPPRARWPKRICAR